MTNASWAVIVLAALTVFVLGWIAGRGMNGTRTLSGPTAVRTLNEVGPALRSEIESAIAAGRKIEAIKLLRDATGMGLRESKAAVEAMEQSWAVN
ncbi:ribosomal protein L7/L12 [Novosphingobium album (ex Hu et al. 2023)]|uniref:Ribosomal protein L7/L12 n=1 Tax=Novosphingobium album (ex Hu et al. 2023) TaxID=2930093 RepID=A0ABT0B2Q5_9SPHN|nr:ribosomal protein L7/L12 [Novosphingobium album (ex Hu et al. 2023)]MCJ2179336.1 ribosomal protein L7/L12 [Novosphingobium album (ex Hu et al. 2023)]